MTNFKILSLDGGGIRGFFTAHLLSLIEDDLKLKYGSQQHIVDHVDLFCGTSTGGLIALALAMRIPASKICHFYRTGGPKIFRHSEGRRARLRQALWSSKYSDDNLRMLLQELFGGLTIGDSEALLCIPTFDFTHGTYEIFKYDHAEGNLNRHNKLPVVDVALATAAAPTYFPLAQVPGLDDTQFVDGGVWANNPALVGLTESLWHFAKPGSRYDSTRILSISCLNAPSGQLPLASRNRGFLRWAPDLFELGLIGQSEFTHEFLNMLAHTGTVPLKYNRVTGPSVGAKQAGLLKLDLASREALTLMRQLATDTYHSEKNSEGVQSFFGSPKSYLIDR